MATFVFDGTSNITAAKTDTVVITANPALFTNAADSNGNVVFNFGGRLLTITGTTFGPNADSFPNVSLANGIFSTSATGALNTATPNELVINASAGIGTAIDLSGGSVANGVKAFFGGIGTADANDGQDSVVIGGKGSFLVYGNAGADAVTQAVDFDSTSFITSFAGKGNDSITLNGTNVGAKMAIYGGEGNDTISITNGGTNANTTIFGGQGAADSTDGSDTITYTGGGTVNIFGNAGTDGIILNTLDSTSVVVVHGGRDADTITATVAGSAKAVVSVFGDENTTGTDTISVTGNAGTTVIYGGTAAADSADGADSITYSGQGTATIYAAGGDDTIVLAGRGTVTLDSTSTVTAFGGAGKDLFKLTALTTDQTVTLTGGDGADTYTFGTQAVGAVTESSAITFQDVADKGFVTVGGLTFTATAANTAVEVAEAFDQLAAGAQAVAPAKGTFTGALTGFTSTASDNGVTANVTFTSTAPGNVNDITVNASGTAPTVSTTQGVAGSAAVAAGTGSTTTITDFAVASDRIIVDNGQVTNPAVQIVNGATASTLQGALDLAAASNGGANGTVSVVAFQGNSYVVVNQDNNTVFNANADLAIKLTGVTDLAQLQAAVSVV
nr:hypothetical protein NG677_01475 [Methylobacterium sp. OTU13CASTA1]